MEVVLELDEDAVELISYKSVPTGSTGLDSGGIAERETQIESVVFDEPESPSVFAENNSAAEDLKPEIPIIIQSESDPAEVSGAPKERPTSFSGGIKNRGAAAAPEASPEASTPKTKTMPLPFLVDIRSRGAARKLSQAAGMDSINFINTQLLVVTFWSERKR